MQSQEIAVTERFFSIPAPLLEWYYVHKRAMPWRDDPTPYRVWLSEIMLQQTRVEAVRSYFLRFVEACPDARTLAELPEERLMKLWEGLGYYNRARNLQKTAQILCAEHGGELPADFDSLRALPGIGDYTAGAIASIAFGIRQPAVDGNVCRVFARLLATRADIAAPPVKAEMRGLALRLVEEQDAPGDFNQALMELGATVCLPHGAPLCESCPLAELCAAREKGVALELPVKARKKERRIEEHTIVFIRSGRGLLLYRRASAGLLRGMYEPLNLPGRLDREQLMAFFGQIGCRVRGLHALGSARHIFTHLEWHMEAWLVESDAFKPPERSLWVENPADYAVASAFKAWKEQFLSGTRTGREQV